MANNDNDTRNYSIKKLISIFQDIANNNDDIKSFGFGDASLIGSNNQLYPLLWVDYLPVNMTENSIQYAFQVIIADLTETDNSDVINRRTDTLAILWDVIKTLDQTYDLIVDFTGTTSPFQDAKIDKISGYYKNINILIYMTYDACDVPPVFKYDFNSYLFDYDLQLVDENNSGLITE